MTTNDKNNVTPQRRRVVKSMVLWCNEENNNVLLRCVIMIYDVPGLIYQTVCNPVNPVNESKQTKYYRGRKMKWFNRKGPYWRNPGTSFCNYVLERQWKKIQRQSTCARKKKTTKNKEDSQEGAPAANCVHRDPPPCSNSPWNTYERTISTARPEWRPKWRVVSFLRSLIRVRGALQLVICVLFLFIIDGVISVTA